MTPLAPAEHRAPLSVAFYGRTGSHRPQPIVEAILAIQYERCRAVLPPSALTAAFYDVGSPNRPCPAPAALDIDGQPVSRSGNLHDLLAEAARTARRFDFVIASDLDRLPRHLPTREHTLRALAASGVEFIVAPLRRSDDPADGPLPMQRLRSADYLVALAGTITEGAIR